MYLLATAGWSVEVLTVFAGNTDPLIEPLDSAFTDVEARRSEDAYACDSLSVRWRHLDLQEALLRAHSGDQCYPTIESVMRKPHPHDWCSSRRVAREVVEAAGDCPVAWPAGSSRHVDHGIVAAAGILAGAVCWYDDAPWFAGRSLSQVHHHRPPKRSEVIIVPTAYESRSAKCQAINAYKSQVPILCGGAIRADDERLQPERLWLRRRSLLDCLNWPSLLRR